MKALDPKPYIRTFEAALQQLQRIQTSVTQKELQAAREAEKAEVGHCREVIGISQNFGVS